MKVWITKYALTQGIFSIDAEDEGGGMVADRRTHAAIYYHGEGREWHRTHDAAIVRAEVIRDAKIASIEAQLRKLRAMTFAKKDEQ